jgi:hypothetical protein
LRQPAECPSELWSVSRSSDGLAADCDQKNLQHAVIERDAVATRKLSKKRLTDHIDGHDRLRRSASRRGSKWKR